MSRVARVSDGTVPSLSSAGPCRVCGCRELGLVKVANIATKLQAEDFAITDDAYGRTAAIYRCPQCAFMQCHDIPDVLEFYEGLEDVDYENGREQRGMQARALLKTILNVCDRPASGLRLLDVGGGSGILLEVALQMGIRAEGIEPSNWLVSVARERGYCMHHGVLPHAQARGPYDIVTLIDVIEHVTNPLALLEAAAAVLRREGVLVVVTPDASSVAARLMGWRWWHYRVAHIGYFNASNLSLLCGLAGLRTVTWKRPGWYFSVSYLHQRLVAYLPRWMLRQPAAWMSRVVVPLNLCDSLLVICRRAEGDSDIATEQRRVIS